uniref:Histamine N-methyltransferase n=1 Tax=Xenopus tropicalis TaxID=8364 RepID=A0A6I8QBX4_XENTR
MDSGLRSLLSDHSRYVESFRLFLLNSTEHQCMQRFIDTQFPHIVSSIGKDKSVIDILGIGSGSGEIDLQMIGKIQSRHPGVAISNQIVEPSAEQIIGYKGNSGWSMLWKKHGPRLPLNDLCLYVTAGDIAQMLSSMGTRFQSYELPSDMDITECFIEGDRNGEMLLDFLTETCDFKRNAPADLREQILCDLKSPECSTTRDGKVIFNNNLSVIVVERD